MFGKTKKIHFIGIGGIGMSGMAELLNELGFSITGSDMENSERIHHLINKGIQIKIGHDKSNVSNCDVIVYSSAIKNDNIEIITGINKKIPTIKRAEMLSELLKIKDISIAIGGTHGKTTTCSMLGCILSESNLDPTLVIGGIVNKFQSNTISGKGNIIVVEADEFDKTFLTLKPTLSLITNLDLEHLDCYENLTDLKKSFIQFANAIPFYGKVAICIDHKNTSSILTKIKRPFITFGINEEAEIRATNFIFNNNHSSFDLLINNKRVEKIDIKAPGKHNVTNALGAISLALELEIPIEKIKTGLSSYNGVRRRFEIKFILKNEIMIIDDYAHHPSEVSSTLNAAKSGWNKRIIAIFQPHLFTRTRDFHKEFAKAFLNSDILIITDIYPARELPISGVTAELISKETIKMGHTNVEYIPNKEDIPHRLLKIAQPGDIIMTMGAGDIWRQCDKIYEVFKN